MNFHAQHRVATARFDEAKAACQKNILTAFQEVSDAFVTCEKLAQIYVFYGQADMAPAESVQLAKQHYLNDKSSYCEVLQTQPGELPAVRQFYQAPGGDWQTPAGGKKRRIERF